MYACVTLSMADMSADLYATQTNDQLDINIVYDTYQTSTCYNPSSGYI
jgi:hypothetical protein